MYSLGWRQRDEGTLTGSNIAKKRQKSMWYKEGGGQPGQRGTNFESRGFPHQPITCCNPKSLKKREHVGGEKGISSMKKREGGQRLRV